MSTSPEDSNRVLRFPKPAQDGRDLPLGMSVEQAARDHVFRLQAILDHVKDGIVSCDSSGRIESMNRTAERFFQVQERDMLGKGLETLLPQLAVDRGISEALEALAIGDGGGRPDASAFQTFALAQRDGLLPAEVLVSEVQLGGRTSFIVCVRDTAERSKSELALRDSEARYKVLVENAPEAVVVIDVDQQKFTDCNENAVGFFKMPRERLLECGPEQVSAPVQADGTLSFGVVRGHVEAALAGGTPTFEWLHRDGDGRDIPCEVRLVRLPSSTGRFLRASIIDITDRKRGELLAQGERRVFERIASNGTLVGALEAITEVIEQQVPQALCCVRLYDAERQALLHAAGPRLPREYVAQMDEVHADIRYGSCASAIALNRQIIVPDIEKDPYWEYRREAALRCGLRACWSTPIRGADGSLLGTFAVYLKRTGLPSRRDHGLMSRMTQLSRIAIERRRAEDAVRESEARYRGLFENVVEGVYQVTLDGKLLSANPALYTMLGYQSFEQMRDAGSTVSLYVDPEARLRLIERVLRDGEVVALEYELRRRDGSVITVSDSARAMRDGRGRVTGFEGTINNITERRRAEQRLFDEKERAQVTLQSIADAVITTDREGLIDYMNPVAESLTQLTAAQAAGQPVSRVVRLVLEESALGVEDPVARCMREGSAVALADGTTLINSHDDEIAIQATASPIRDRQGLVAGAVMVFHDVSRERRMRRLLSYQASHDALTGLINRREFENRLSVALESARQDPTVRHALVYVDLDNFKVVNDTCGHAAGDQLLRQVTGLLQTRVRAADVLARLGGDEFGILLTSCAAERGMRIADSLRQAIRDFRFNWEGNQLQVGASIGIVEISSETDGIASLLSAADMACYSAKDGGRNRVHAYDREEHGNRHREMQWVSRLTRASEESRLELVFQPIVPVADVTGTLLPHYELLMRLKDEEGKLVMPNEFIPAAERYNVMPVLDRWVVDQVLEKMVPSRRDVEKAEYTIAINLSGTSLSDPGFLQYLIERLEEHEPTPGVLCFEITETAAITNLASASHVMRELTSRGCLMSLDDFGSGLSSFNYLRTLPVHYLKIDGQFVHSVAHDAIDRSMVEAIAQVGRSMGIQTIAERVESAEVFETLKTLGVTYAQGYYIARPAPLSEFPHALCGA
ncbi:MAG: EAL domain-containing protein [Gammaproteobacteria bacterium]|nr:EAL domain-containing protein [Gammaproteobacteria bacterium]